MSIGIDGHVTERAFDDVRVLHDVIDVLVIFTGFSVGSRAERFLNDVTLLSPVQF